MSVSFAACMTQTTRPEGLQAHHGKRRHWTPYIAATLAGTALGVLSLVPRTPLLVWNFTPSVPQGLYLIESYPPHVGDLIAIRPEGKAAALLSETRALKPGRILIKPLAAVAGATVCRRGTEVAVDGKIVAIAQASRVDGVALPIWSDCIRLGARDALVLSHHPASFDSRYFGPIATASILGIARPLLTFAGKEGRS